MTWGSDCILQPVNSASGLDFSGLFCVCVQLRNEQVESVNVGGTKNIITGEETRWLDGVLAHFQPGEGNCAASPVCTDRSIPRLVYTSTINVVFTGEPIRECDESSASYVPPDKVSIPRTPSFPP